MASNEVDDQEAGETRSAQSRFWLTNDILAFVLVVGFMLLVALGAARDGQLELSAVPVNFRVALVAYVGIAVAWGFGTSAVEAWRST